MSDLPELLPCPRCGKDVTCYGQECYPEYGFTVECNNIECDYEISMSFFEHKVSDLAIVAYQSHNEFCRLLGES